jgi:hypothetical protein
MDSHTTPRPARGRRLTLLAAIATIAAGAATQGCNVNDKLLGANDPDLVPPASLQNADGAEALRVGALERWRLTTGGDNTNGNDNTWLFGGLLADEWATSSTFVQNDEADERRIKLDNSTVTFGYRKLNRVRTAADQAIPAMVKYRPTETTKIAELYLARGYAELQLASDFCNGIPLSNAATEDGSIEYGTPLRVAEVFDVAVASLDSGLAVLGTATDAEAVRVGSALKIAKARALMGNGKVAEAAALVTAIPTSYSYEHTYSKTAGQNAIWGQPASGRRYNVGDSLEGNARNILVKNNIPFFSAKDPRVPANYTITIRSNGRADTTKAQDGQLNSRTTTLFGEETPVAVANGIDARLIEAEAKVKTDPAGMLKILNDLRAAPPKLGAIQPAAMPALADPGTLDARVNLLFREKAFWTFSRGQRLGDLRRLIRQYDRTPDTTFPVGTHYRGGTYGPDVNLPVPQEEENNPNFHGCLDRNA